MPIQRATAYKLKIGEILSGKPIMDGDRLSALEVGEKKINKINVVANIIEKFVSEGEKKYVSLTIDDASGQIKVRIFGESVERFKDVDQGHTVLIIGMLRSFNNEVYVLPDIIRVLDPKYLLVRKLEFEQNKPKEVNKEEIKELKDKILDMIKNSEGDGGAETEEIILKLKSDPDLINKEIQKLLEEGLIYEPRPGKIRFLG